MNIWGILESNRKIVSQFPFLSSLYPFSLDKPTSMITFRETRYGVRAAIERCLERVFFREMRVFTEAGKEVIIETISMKSRASVKRARQSGKGMFTGRKNNTGGFIGPL